MYPFEVSYIDDLDVTIVTALRPFTADDVRQLFRDVFEGNSRRNVVWVLRSGTLNLLDTEDLKALFMERAEALAARVHDQSFYVVHGVAEKLLFRWYQAFWSELDLPGVHLTVCATFDEALAGLRQSSKAAHS